MGRLYFTGNCVAKDLAVAAQWYEQAAEKGDIDSEIQSAFCYQLGNGVPQLRT